MRYFLILILFFLGCNNNKITKPKPETNISNTKNLTKTLPKKEENLTVVNIDNLTLKFKNNKLIYPNQKTILLFTNKTFYSQEEKRILKKLNVSFYETNNTFLINYFNIKLFPTIVVLDNNKTTKFENFTPYEILKAEGF